MQSMFGNVPAQPAGVGEEGETSTDLVPAQFLTKFVGGGEGAVPVTTHRDAVKKDAGITPLGYNHAVSSKHVQKDLTEAHDLLAARLTVEDQDEIRGKLGAPVAANEFNRGPLSQREQLADSRLQTTDNGGSLVRFGGNLGEARGSGVPHYSKLGGGEGLRGGGLRRLRGRSPGRGVDLRDVRSDE